MTEKLEIYRCYVCGNVIQVLNAGEGMLVCCGQAMEKAEPKYEENEMGEKHVPEIVTEHEGCEEGACYEKRFIRLDKHPMVSEHYIQFIEAYNEDKTELRIKFLNPEEKAEYEITDFRGGTKALEHCNIHGLWRNKE